MPTITIDDLDHERVLDRKAMSSVRGGGAPWVFGWIRPYVPAEERIGPAVNFFQINNYYADQMINQFQVVDVKNSAPNSNVSVVLGESGANSRLPAQV